MEDDQTYFYRRAEEEIAQARASADEKLVSFHYVLAGYYLDLVYGNESDPRHPNQAAAAARTG